VPDGSGHWRESWACRSVQVLECLDEREPSDVRHARRPDRSMRFDAVRESGETVGRPTDGPPSILSLSTQRGILRPSDFNLCLRGESAATTGGDCGSAFVDCACVRRVEPVRYPACPAASTSSGICKHIFAYSTRVEHAPTECVWI